MTYTPGLVCLWKKRGDYRTHRSFSTENGSEGVKVPAFSLIARSAPTFIPRSVFDTLCNLRLCSVGKYSEHGTIRIRTFYGSKNKMMSAGNGAENAKIATQSLAIYM
ncbi:hypothetical protein A0H81_09402 [Grifola frondosa]|uniref:Uncharacterized protein n=1 Tax=Grifola frondosa TaxID=5627 RepID=A0A1C7M2H5_GRIFR|nr:hypothetical protein A0H81_09402 [Grifola frondosa]